MTKENASKILLMKKERDDKIQSLLFKQKSQNTAMYALMATVAHIIEKNNVSRFLIRTLAQNLRTIDEHVHRLDKMLSKKDSELLREIADRMDLSADY